MIKFKIYDEEGIIADNLTTPKEVKEIINMRKVEADDEWDANFYEIIAYDKNGTLGHWNGNGDLISNVYKARQNFGDFLKNYKIKSSLLPAKKGNKMIGNRSNKRVYAASVDYDEELITEFLYENFRDRDNSVLVQYMDENIPFIGDKTQLNSFF